MCKGSGTPSSEKNCACPACGRVLKAVPAMGGRLPYRVPQHLPDGTAAPYTLPLELN